MSAIRDINSSQVVQEFEDADRKCPICLRDTMRKVATLTCGHSFDEVCIKKAWEVREQNRKCPVCRTDQLILPTKPDEIQRLQGHIEKRARLQADCDKNRVEEPLEVEEEIKLQEESDSEESDLEFDAGMMARRQRGVEDPHPRPSIVREESDSEESASEESASEESDLEFDAGMMARRQRSVPVGRALIEAFVLGVFTTSVFNYFYFTSITGSN